MISFKSGMLGILLSAACFGGTTVFAQDQVRYQAQYQNALQLLQNNFQPGGGIVAAPSHDNPNYFYDWVRDSSVTMKTLIQIAYDPKTDAKLAQTLQARIDLWVNWELGLQTTPKAPPLFDLGEPRFYLTGKVNDQPWARPQNDGPALRAIAGIELANNWIKQGRFHDVTARLYAGTLPANTLIKRDLEYVAHHWGEQSFDLWEEEKAMHFYTLTAQKVAMIKGAALATQLNDGGAASFYQQQATAIDSYLAQFFDSSQNVIRYSIDKDPNNSKYFKTSELDVAVLLAAIQTFDGQFYVPVDQMVATVTQLSAQFQSIYHVNQLTKDPNTGAALGVAIGRYPQDVYSGSGSGFDGGNPWFLATLALGEFACDLKAANYHAASGLGSSAAELTQVANAQFNRVLYHLDQTGSMAEQFNRDTGFEQSAPNLTWSYASYLSAYRACF